MPYDWVITTTDDSGTFCWICFGKNDSNDRLLGDAFLRGYYSVLDYNRHRFGFSPHNAEPEDKGRVGHTSKHHTFKSFVSWASGLEVRTFLVDFSGGFVDRLLD